MSTKNTNCALFLCPKQTDFTISNTTQFITELKNIGLIAEEINNQENSFYTGEQYLDYIVYMGCAPTIQFEASESNRNFCKIKIHQYTSEKLFVSQIQARAPHCPNCNKPVKDWTQNKQNNKKQNTIHCNLCETSVSINEYDWRKMGGYGRVFIEITDIFPKEAIPQKVLLDKLAHICDTDWLYFYCCQ